MSTNRLIYINTAIVLFAALSAVAYCSYKAVAETTAANEQRALAIATMLSYESLARTMHGNVTPQYVCRIREGVRLEELSQPTM